MPGGVKCIQCGRSIKSDEHRHMVSMKWPVDVLEWVQRNATFGEAKVGAAMCCAHFDEPVHRNFSKHNPPKLIVSLDGTAWVSPSTRRSLALKRKKKKTMTKTNTTLICFLCKRSRRICACNWLICMLARRGSDSRTRTCWSC